MSTSSTRKGVRLTLPGAPDEPHQIPGLSVYVRPGAATAVDDDTLARAQELIDAGADLEIVDVDPADDAGAPWPGYAGATVKDVIARLEDLDAGQLTALAAYETDHDNRAGVLDAVAKRLDALKET